MSYRVEGIVLLDLRLVLAAHCVYLVSRFSSVLLAVFCPRNSYRTCEPASCGWVPTCLRVRGVFACGRPIDTRVRLLGFPHLMRAA